MLHRSDGQISMVIICDLTPILHQSTSKRHNDTGLSAHIKSVPTSKRYVKLVEHNECLVNAVDTDGLKCLDIDRLAQNCGISLAIPHEIPYWRLCKAIGIIHHKLYLYGSLVAIVGLLSWYLVM